MKMKAILDCLGVQYEYQLPVRSGFVLDFAFREQMKAIEVDGYYHQFSGPRDDFRDGILKRAGWIILRIKAEDLEDPNLPYLIQTYLTPTNTTLTDCHLILPLNTEPYQTEPNRVKPDLT